MAISYLLNSALGSGVFNGVVTVTAPPKAVSGLNYTLVTDRMTFEPGLENTQGTVLNSRYKVGGSGSWERPWGPYLP